MSHRTPNILMIVCDDLNAWIGALGRHPQVSTPAIDALAAKGSLFTRAYCPAPYCNPSRISAFTGCLPTTTGIYHDEPFWSSPDRRQTYVEYLKANGFYTFGAGKVFHGVFDYRTATRDTLTRADWVDTQHGDPMWDEFILFSPDHLPSSRPVNGLYDFTDFENVPPPYYLFDWGPLPNELESTMPDTLTADAIAAFLKAPSAEPFFCAAGIYKPHLPWHVPQRFFDQYPLESIVLPLVKADDLNDVPLIAREWAASPRDHERVTTRDQWPHAIQGYLAAISYCDSLVARLLDALDSSPAAENTIVVFMGRQWFSSW